MFAINIGSLHCSVRFIICNRILMIIYYYQTSLFLFENWKKICKSAVQLIIFKVNIQTRNAQQQWNVCHHKHDKSSSILLDITCSDKIKCIQKF